MHKNDYTKYLYIICLAIYGYSRACIEKRSKEKDGKHSKTVEKVDVHILTSHTTTLKSMGSKAIAIPPECTPCFALRVCQSCESCEALFFLETPQEVFSWSLLTTAKLEGFFLIFLLPACKTLTGHVGIISTSSWRKTNTECTFTASRGPLQTMAHALETAWHNENKNSNTNKGIYSSKLSFVQRIVCNIYEPIP